jgi:hypothetical protein
MNASTGEIQDRMSYGIRWIAGDTWQEYSGIGWATASEYLNLTSSSHGPISFDVGLGEWRFVIKLPGNARYSYWFLTVSVLDRAGFEGKSSLFSLGF